MRQTPGTETVLVVEDYPNVRTIIVAILKGHGYQVLEAGNGAEALAVAERHSGLIDLLVSDVQMPTMNGPELVQQLRIRQPNLRVLFVSAHGEGSWSEELMTGPGISWITKPFAPNALAVQVRKLLDAPAKGRSATDKM
jgi:CheY-like chemotaxis protein